MVTGSPQTEPIHAFPPTATPSHPVAFSPPSKRDLASWWRQFKRNSRNKEEAKVNKPQGIFGVPLNVSIKYANVAISLTNDNGESFIYGYVPIVVAKCGVFLKEKATDVEGIFRLNGSAKRIKDLQEIFNSPERYGKGLDWTGYTVHDAANVLRRYLNQLPEPIVPLEFYEQFRQPLNTYQRQAQGHMPANESEIFDHPKAVEAYQQLIRELPPLNKQLLLYILDLLAVFASKSDQNLMTSANLSAIFQPGLLSHPQHDMSPNDYRLSQDVLTFLIENQDHFLFGMNGTAADPETVKAVESGGLAPRAPTTTQTSIRRSVSSASGGADSFRKYGSLGRNVSVSSKNSRASNARSPSTPSSLAGVHRSNTLPSKMAARRAAESSTTTTTTTHSHAPAASVAATSSAKNASGVPTPATAPHVTITSDPTTPLTTTTTSTTSTTATSSGAPIASASSSTTPTIPAASTASNSTGPAPSTQPTQPSPPTDGQRPAPESEVTTSGPVYLHSATHGPVPKRTGGDRVPSTEQPPDVPPQSTSPPPVVTPTKERKLSSLFSKSPPSEQRQPNRLRKKRSPGSVCESAQSSSQSLQDATDLKEASTTVKPSYSTPPIDESRPLGTNQDAAHGENVQGPTTKFKGSPPTSLKSKSSFTEGDER